MAAKRLLFGEAGRARLLVGVRTLAGAVRPTLGPGGRNVLLQRPMHSTPLATKDGVTVAEEIELADRFANMGAQLTLEGAAKTSFAAGDGTTTATLLAHAIYREGARLVAAGHHPMELKRGIELAVEHVVAALRKASKRATVKLIAQVATVSANGDAAIGKIVATAVAKVGFEGIIHVEQGSALETTLEVAEGSEIDRGFLSAYFITDPERLIAELEDPLILLHEKKITRLQELVPILEKVASGGRSLLVVGEVEGEALQALVVNKLKGTLKVCAILPPSYGERRKDMLRDLAAQTGGRAITDEPGLTLEHVKLEDLGRAKRVAVSQEKTTIIGGAGRKADIEVRALQIRAKYEATNSDFDHQQLEERLRKLVGGAAVLRVGGTTDPEVREKKLRFEDALYATRAAIEEGIVPGGGVALIRAASSLAELKFKDDRQYGVQIIRRAIEEPLRQIAINAGHEGSIVVDKVKNGKGAFGFNAATEEYEDLIKAGVIDPAKVVRAALQNAASVASLMLSTQALITEAPKRKPGASESAEG